MSIKVLKLLELIKEAPLECPIIILGDFNVDLSNGTTQDYEIKKLLDFIYKQNFKQHISVPTTQLNSLIDHIWSNIPGTETKYGVTDAYWPDYHKPIYCAFKLPTTLQKYYKSTTLISRYTRFVE